MQQLINHLRYFLFIANYFNPVLAICIIYDEIRGELKYNIQTTSITETKKLKIKGFDTTGANEYMPSNYVLLNRVFKELNTYSHNKTFIDIGCGKGRALIVAAHFGFQELTGVEFIATHCQDAQKQIHKIEKLFNKALFHIICMDATQYEIPDHAQTLFFYNPFNEEVMNKVIQNIRESLVRKKRQLFVIYFSPLYKQNFIEIGFREIYRTARFNFLKASILTLS